MVKGITNQWSEIRKRFFDGYANTDNKYEYITKFAFQNGLRLEKVKEWAYLSDEINSMKTESRISDEELLFIKRRELSEFRETIKKRSLLLADKLQREGKQIDAIRKRAEVYQKEMDLKKEIHELRVKLGDRKWREIK